MALMTRISRLLAADVHAVLDRLEEPEALLKQALRDMQDAVARTEQRLIATRLEHDRLAHGSRSNAEALAVCASELDVCFAAGEDGLARTVLKRRLEIERRQKRIADACAEARVRVADLERQLAEERSGLDDLEQKVALLGETAGAPSTGSACEPVVSAAEVEIAFLEETQRRTRS